MTSETALFAAAKAGDTYLLDQALREGQISVPSLVNREGESLAHVCSRKGHLQFLKRLVTAGTEVDITNAKGRGLVHEAAQNAQLHILKYLHSIHADFSALSSTGDSVLDVAKNREIEEYLESVLEIGVSGTPSSARGKKGGRKKKERHGKLSDLKEVQGSDQIFPSDGPIPRTHLTREFDGVQVTVCDLSDVGWAEGADLGFPKRPDWQSLGLDSASALHACEEQLFSDWLTQIDALDNVCSFERNLEFWREMWRVMERGDLYLIIADARNPLLHLNKGFLTHLRTTPPLDLLKQRFGCAGKEMRHVVVLCLSKCDLVHPQVLEAWKGYLESELSVEVVCVSCKDDGESRRELLETILRAKPFENSELTSEMSSRSVEELIGMEAGAILEFRDAKNTTRKKKLSKKARGRIAREEQVRRDARDGTSEDDTDSPYSASEEDEEERDVQKPIVISIMGEPNVGKSSVINYLLGIKKVSVSAHPGRTKHLQTHFLCPNLILCDCPGLVFPKRHVPFPMQVLFGCFPIARCRDAYSVVEFLASHITPPLPTLLTLAKLSNPLQDSEEWSVLQICESLASKKKWTTHRGGRWDTYRSANWILRGALAGRDHLILSFFLP